MVEKISQKFIYEQEATQRQQLASRMPLNYFAAAPFVSIFGEATSAIGLLETEAQQRVDELTSDVDEREVEHKEFVKELESKHKALVEQFKTLDSRINDIGNTAVQI